MQPLHFEREITITAPRERVFAELVTPERFLGLQPLLTAIEERPGADGTRVFAATERVPVLGPLRVPSRLCVELRPDAEASRVEFATRAPLGIRLRGAFVLTDAADGTRVVESVELVCARWLRGFVAPQATRAQEGLLANLKRRLEAEKG